MPKLWDPVNHTGGVRTRSSDPSKARADTPMERPRGCGQADWLPTPHPRI